MCSAHSAQVLPEVADRIAWLRAASSKEATPRCAKAGACYEANGPKHTFDNMGGGISVFLYGFYHDLTIREL